MAQSTLQLNRPSSCLALRSKKAVPKPVARNKDDPRDMPGSEMEPKKGFIDHPAPHSKLLFAELLRKFARENDLVLDHLLG